MSEIKDLLDPAVNRRKTSCQCNLCEGHRKVREVIGRRNVDELVKFVEDFSEMLCNNGEELGMANAYIEELRAASPEPEPIEGTRMDQPIIVDGKPVYGEGTKEGRETVLPDFDEQYRADMLSYDKLPGGANMDLMLKAQIRSRERQLLAALQPPIAAAPEWLDDLEKTAEAAGPDPWRVGTLLSTSQTRHWSNSQREYAQREERRHVFAGFYDYDEGRGRVEICQVSEHHMRWEIMADYIAKANPAAILELIKLVRAALPSPGESRK